MEATEGNCKQDFVLSYFCLTLLAIIQNEFFKMHYYSFWEETLLNKNSCIVEATEGTPQVIYVKLGTSCTMRLTSPPDYSSHVYDKNIWKCIYIFDKSC